MGKVNGEALRRNIHHFGVTMPRLDGNTIKNMDIRKDMRKKKDADPTTLYCRKHDSGKREGTPPRRLPVFA